MDNPIVKRGRTRKFFIFGAGLCAVLALLFTSASVGLNSTAFRDWLLGQIDRNMNGHFTLDRLDLSLLSGRMRFTNAVLTDSEGTLLATIDQGELVVAWSALLWKELRVKRLYLIQPKVHLFFDARNQLTIAALFPNNDTNPPSGPPAFPANVVIDDLRLTEASLTLTHPNQGLDLAIERIDLQAAGDLAAQRGRLNLTVESIRQQAGSEELFFGPIRLEAQYNDRAESPLTLALQLSESQVGAGGGLERENGALVLKVAGDFDLALAETGALLPDAPDLKGRAAGHFNLTGALDDPEISLTMEIIDAAVLGIDAKSVAIDLHLAQRQIALKHLAGKGSWGAIEASGRFDLRPLFPYNFSQKSGAIAALEHDLTISLQGLQLWHLPMVPLPWLGEWQGRLHLTGQGVPLLEGHGRLESELEVRGFSLPIGIKTVDGTATTDSSWNDGAITVEGCRLVIDRTTTVTAQGIVDLDRETLEACAQVTSTRLASLGPFLDLPLPEGRATLAVETQSALSEPELKATLRAEALEVQGIVLGNLSARLHLDKELQLRIESSALANQSSSLSATGWIALDQDDPTIQLDLHFNSLDPAHFMTLPGFSAQLGGLLTVGGSLENPVADLHLEPGQLSFRGFTSGIAAAASWRQDQLRVTRLSLFREHSDLAMQGEISWQDRPMEDPHVKLNLLGEKLQLTDFDNRFKGVVSLKSDLSGPLSRLKGRFDLSGDNLDLAVQQVKTLRCRGQLDEHSVVLEQLAFGWGPQQMISGHGRYDYDGQIACNLAAHGLALAHFDRLRQLEIDGKLDLSLHVEGPPNRPTATASLAISRPRLAGLALDDIQLQLQLQDGSLETRGQVVFPLTATLELDSGDFTAAADMTHTDLSPYLRLAGLTGWRGRLSGQVAMAGNLDQWDQARLKVDLTDLLLAQAGTEVAKAERLALTLQNGIVELPATRLRLMRRGNLTVAAHGPLATGLDISAAGQIPTAVLETLSDIVTPATGQVVINASATGPARDLTWTADLLLENIGLGLPTVVQRIEHLNGRISLTPNLITITGIAAEIDEGRLTAEGQLGLTDLNLASGRLALKLQNLPFEIPGTLDLILDSDLNLQSTGGQSMLEGHVTLLEGSYYKDVRLDLLGELARLTKPQRSVTAAGPPPAWLERIGLNVAVTARNPFIVDNNMAGFDIVPDLKVVGTAARPLATGRAGITEGTVVFRGRKFNINHGSVDFINPYKLEPNFNIEAVATIRQWEVTLAVSGTPDQLVIRLSSDPAESENDILSLILLGQTTAELSSGQGGATTEQMLAGLIATAWGDDLKKSAHVDILEVETGAESATDSADRIQVTVGKKINSRMTLKYEVESNNGEMIQRAVSEYRLIEHLLASGFQDNHGRYGGELLFRLEFR